MPRPKLTWLYTHRARTDASAGERHLRPRRVHAGMERTSALLSAVAGEPGWQAGDGSRPSGPGELHLVHLTGLFKFKDDVRIQLRAEGDATLVEASSKSRIGKGDLGQNERNLQALWEGLERKAREAGIEVTV